MRLGPVEESSALNYFDFDDPKSQEIVAGLIGLMKAVSSGGPVVLVTHIWNIKGDREMVIARFDGSGNVTVVGRIAPPH